MINYFPGHPGSDDHKFVAKKGNIRDEEEIPCNKFDSFHCNSNELRMHNQKVNVKKFS